MKAIFTLIISLFLMQAAFSQTFTIKSNDLGGQFTNEFTANSFGCNGGNKSPELTGQAPLMARKVLLSPCMTLMRLPAVVSGIG